MKYLFAMLIALSSTASAAQDTPTAMLNFVEQHCVRKVSAGAFYDLPPDWQPVGARAARSFLPNLAIEEGIDYAAFITWQVEVSEEVDADKAWPLTLETYEKQLSDERYYTRAEWQRLFIHRPSGAYLFISAGEDTDDPDDWFPPQCYLWHPKADAPLSKAIIARWDIPFANRLMTRMGQATHAWNTVVIDGEDNVLETRVIQPDTEFNKRLAPVILKLLLRY